VKPGQWRALIEAVEVCNFMIRSQLRFAKVRADEGHATVDQAFVGGIF
jgi:hypothetical protein